MNSIQQAQRLGQEMWLDYIRRGLLKSGELQKLVDAGISGLTANPTILEKAILGSTDYDPELMGFVHTDKQPQEIYETLAIEDVRASAALFRPVFDRTKGERGYACLEISPLLAHDAEGSIRESRRLFAALGRPNVMVKVPATPEGIPVIRQLTAEGINVNVTLIFSPDFYKLVAEAYISGLEELAASGGDVTRVASVASFFLSRIDTIVDNLLDERIHKGDESLKPLQGTAAVASARLAYQQFRDIFYGERFAALKAKGARVQRPLWASTGTKNPHYNDLKYVESLIGPDTVNTLPLATIYAFLDHGKAELTIDKGVDEARRQLDDLAAAGISLEQVTDQLLVDGVKSFSDSFDKLMAGIAEKKRKLQERPPSSSVGKYLASMENTLDDIKKNNVVERIWRKDYTVWKANPTEIVNRLGWLTVAEAMMEQVPAMQSLSREVLADGYRFIVLLGMGGSSLGAEVMRQTFGSARAFPKLFVLDSTVPAAVRAVTQAIEPSETLFLVSSKSGTTTEPNLLFKYSHNLVMEKVGKDNIGRNFVAITDPRTPLAGLAARLGFRRTFLNPTDIGGRYSALSYFGLVPAALIGIDIMALLEQARKMTEACASCVPGGENPGLWWGAYMGTLAQQCRDKMTLITSPGLSSFGLWVEQLIAESTGKEGKGIIPVSGEPLLDASNYGDDRFFYYLRLEGDDNRATDDFIEAVKAAGHPVVEQRLNDRHELGAEFFRWEFATAIAGHILGINPFDQPDVDSAKDATQRLLREYRLSGRLPDTPAGGSLTELLAGAEKGNYLAIMAYVNQTPETDAAMQAIRGKVMRRYHIATTLGYGPRYLHSTGQLHKGGPNSGLFVQMTADQEEDLPIPGEPYTFGTVARAQAIGDLETLKSRGRRVIRLSLAAAGVK